MVSRALPADCGDRSDRSDRGDMVTGWLVRIVVILAVLAVIGYDAITTFQAQITVRDQASSAAVAGYDNYAWSHNVEAAYQAALADAHSSNPADVIIPADFVVASDGSVTLRLSRPVHTVVARYLPIASAKLATASGVAHPSS
jgi:hypothetical protein